MSNVDCLVLTDDNITLEGFEKIGGEDATFCFYESGVIIEPFATSEQAFYFPVKINDKREITDKQVIDILKRDRKFSEKNYFFYTGNNYAEVHPHKSTL